MRQMSYPKAPKYSQTGTKLPQPVRTESAILCPLRDGGKTMLKRILFFAYGSVSYLIFLATFLYAVGFIGNFGVPSTLDGPATGPLAISLAIDVLLLTVFA